MLARFALSWLLLTAPDAVSFSQDLASAKKALKLKEFENARKLLTSLEAASTPAVPVQERYEMLILAGDLEAAESKLELAARRYAAASHLAEDHSARRRASMQKRLNNAAAMKDKRRQRRLEALGQADQEMSTLLRRPRVGPKDLGAAEARLQAAARIYQKDKDPARAAWARALAAKVRALSSEDAAAALVHASKAVHLVSALPAFVQVMALEAGFHAARRAKEEERELEFALRHSALLARALPEEARPYARSPFLKEVCARYEKAHGAGACSVRAREVTGQWSFVDFSAGKPRDVLTPEDLSAANGQYLPTIKDCVETIARENAEDELFQQAKVTIDWVVGETGRVTELEFAPKRYERYFGDCVRTTAALFRYPRSKGERQTVSVSFELSAPAIRPRRGG